MIGIATPTYIMEARSDENKLDLSIEIENRDNSAKEIPFFQSWLGGTIISGSSTIIGFISLFLSGIEGVASGDLELTRQNRNNAAIVSFIFYIGGTVFYYGGTIGLFLALIFSPFALYSYLSYKGPVISSKEFFADLLDEKKTLPSDNN
eukprot:TRINITY_DN4944_c0_g1_i2.p1 TRINITY_DN4944_c0_g1~~TRINITY_DN4944_c0_g1_i2.p1  ORF type:complete len:149 (-),score=17.40 TRINITY_DN4944_c0_g1_i2:408-854(-)